MQAENILNDFMDTKERGYYNRKGEVVSLREWVALFSSREKIVKRTTIGEMLVSTVFLGIDHNFHSSVDPSCDQRPQIFETMVFSNQNDFDDIYCERSCTEEEAIDEHEKAAEWAKDYLKEGRKPNE